jgi:hypothetical protein
VGSSLGCCAWRREQFGRPFVIRPTMATTKGGHPAAFAHVMKTSFRKKRALYALGMLIFSGAALLLFSIAADEQSISSSGSPVPDKLSLQELMTRGAGSNKHVELADFHIGKQYIYTAKLLQFRDVYLPIFVTAQPETGANLQVLLWVRNDRSSNQRLIESADDLDRFVSEFNRNPQPIKGVLRRPTDRVRGLAIDAYPGTNSDALKVLWARDFPDGKFVNFQWLAVVVCLGAAGFCGFAYRRASRPLQN